MTLLGALAVAALAALGDQPPPSPSPSPPPPARAEQALPSEPSVKDLYRSILPRPVGESESLAHEDPGRQTQGTPKVPREDEARDGGLKLGIVNLSPAFHALHVRAEGALLDTADPVRDRYYEMRPSIGAEAPLRAGLIRGAYEARLRRGSSFDLVESTITHLADLGLDLPLGGVEIRGAEHFARGLLETAEVDPGREYFFRLGRFTRLRHSLGLRLLSGGRADAAVDGSVDVVRVDDQAAFFDHVEQAVSAQIGYEVRADLRAAIGYGHTRIPFTVDRPQAASSVHSVFGELNGEILPLTNGNVSIGYSSRTSPNAGPGGTRFAGLTGSGRVEKSFTRSSSLTLAGARGTHLSNFEQNAFYVTSAFEIILRAAVPWSLALQAGAGYHRNDYRTVASSIGVPRRDRIRGWTFGLARSLTRHAFVRADYRRESRDSTMDAFDSGSNALTVQLGIGVFANRLRW